MRQLLEERRYEGLLSHPEKNAAVIRQLSTFLYTQEGLLRWRAIEGLGYMVGKLAEQDRGFGREIIRRLLWSVNDESGGIGWSTPEAIGEIVRSHPDDYADFVPILVSLQEEDILRRGIIWALGRIGKRRPDLAATGLPLLLESLEHPAAEIRGFAAWSLGEIAAPETAPALRTLRSDHEAVTIYEAGKLWQRTVSEVALNALADIQARQNTKH